MSDFLEIKDKNFLITGVSNKKSVATHTAQTLLAHGARCFFSVEREEQIESLKKIFGPDQPVIVCSVQDIAQIKKLSTWIANQNIKIHGFLHSLAYARFPLDQLDRPFHATPREDFLEATQISAFSLVEMTHALLPHFSTDSSIVTISISNTKATSYGYLGPIKAMLEGIVPYLAHSLREIPIRVNAIGAGPLKTSASAGIPNYMANYLFAEQMTLRKKALTTQEVANLATFLLSPKSSGSNATTLLIDVGMGANIFDKDLVHNFFSSQLK
jgi:enoyl-[acyl-carrier protein] reductase I